MNQPSTGTPITSAPAPSHAMASRHPMVSISQAPSGGASQLPTVAPATVMPSARPRRRTNQFATTPAEAVGPQHAAPMATTPQHSAASCSIVSARDAASKPTPVMAAPATISGRANPRSIQRPMSGPTTPMARNAIESARPKRPSLTPKCAASGRTNTPKTPNVQPVDTSWATKAAVTTRQPRKGRGDTAAELRSTRRARQAPLSHGDAFGAGYTGPAPRGGIPMARKVDWYYHRKG